MRTPLKTAVSVLFYIDPFIWLIGVIPTLYYASTHGACRPWGDKADGWAFLVARHLRFSNRGDPLCCCQRIEGLGRVLAMAFQEGRRGSWANPVRA